MLNTIVGNRLSKDEILDTFFDDVQAKYGWRGLGEAMELVQRFEQGSGQFFFIGSRAIPLKYRNPASDLDIIGTTKSAFHIGLRDWKDPRAFWADSMCEGGLYPLWGEVDHYHTRKPPFIDVHLVSLNSTLLEYKRFWKEMFIESSHVRPMYQHYMTSKAVPKHSEWSPLEYKHLGFHRLYTDWKQGVG